MKRVLPILLAVAIAAVAGAEDSPLVAAAKRANRKGKKATNVITNETLKQSGANARITTTAHQRPFVAPKAYEPPVPTPEMVAAKKRQDQKRAAAAEEAAHRKAAAESEQAAARAAAAAEEGFYDDEEADPAQAEKAQQDATQQKPPRH